MATAKQTTKTNARIAKATTPKTYSFDAKAAHTYAMDYIMDMKRARVSLLNLMVELTYVKDIGQWNDAVEPIIALFVTEESNRVKKGTGESATDYDKRLRLKAQNTLRNRMVSVMNEYNKANPKAPVFIPQKPKSESEAATKKRGTRAKNALRTGVTKAEAKPSAVKTYTADNVLSVMLANIADNIGVVNKTIEEKYRAEINSAMATFSAMVRGIQAKREAEVMAAKANPAPTKKTK